MIEKMPEHDPSYLNRVAGRSLNILITMMEPHCSVLGKRARAKIRGDDVSVHVSVTTNSRDPSLVNIALTTAEAAKQQSMKELKHTYGETHEIRSKIRQYPVSKGFVVKVIVFTRRKRKVMVN